MQTLVKPTNAILATRYLLNLDIDAIKQQYCKTVTPFVLELKEAQGYYMASTIDALDNELKKNLSKMAETVNTLLPMLKEEARKKLLSYLIINEVYKDAL